MQWAGVLRRDLSVRNQQMAITSRSVHELTAGEMPSVIFGRSENRQHAAYCSNGLVQTWAERIIKRIDGVFANSSDDERRWLRA